MHWMDAVSLDQDGRAQRSRIRGGLREVFTIYRDGTGTVVREATQLELAGHTDWEPCNTTEVRTMIRGHVTAPVVRELDEESRAVANGDDVMVMAGVCVDRRRLLAMLRVDFVGMAITPSVPDHSVWFVRAGTIVLKLELG